MEICFENKTSPIYREIFHQTRVIQETAESVVPDVNDDIGRVASVHTSLLLKSKDVTSRGALVTGEVSAVLLYIAEGEKSVAFLRLSRPFTMEFDAAETDVDAVAHIKLRILHCEARVLNPRKVTVGFEILGELSCYRKENIAVETLLPSVSDCCLHERFETVELSCVRAVSEKTFAVNEQYVFPGGKPAPSRLVSQSCDFTVTDTQLIGGKLIVKGSVKLNVCYLSDDAAYPISAEFSSPFSQILDTGEDELDSAIASVELTAVYCDLIDTISGDKALDVELHALLQTVCCKRQKLSYISDAYCNLMPAQCRVQKRQFSQPSPVQTVRLSSDERVNIVDDCADVLYAFSSLSQLSLLPDKLSAAVTLDIIYRGVGGGMSSVRRSVSLESDVAPGQVRLISARLTEVYLRPDGANMDVRVTLEVCCQSCTQMELSRVEAVLLDEEKSIDMEAMPSVCLVRVEKESLWELAKKYRSSVECIAQLNELDGGIEGRILLIPKSI